MPQEPYARLRAILRRNPGVSASARVYRIGHHYVHENSVTLDLEVEGEMENGQLIGSDPDTEKLIFDVQDDMRDWVRHMNHTIKRSLEQELEYQQGDEAVIDSLDANEKYFDEDGEEVDMPHLVTADQLPAHVQMKLAEPHIDLFNTNPQQVIQDLTRRGLKFDQAGEQVDVTQFKLASELEPEAKQKVVEKFRNWNVEDDFWAESDIDYFKGELESFGFRRVEIAYSLGGMQGDGASFTADSVDVETFLDKMIAKKKVESQAAVLVRELLV